MSGMMRTVKEDLLRTRADKIGLVVLTAFVVLFLVLAFLGQPVGAWGLLFLGGAVLPWTLLAATDRSPRWRKPAAVGVLLLFPLWVVAGFLSLSVPALEAFGSSSTDFEPGVGAFIHGLVMVGGILALMKLFGPESRRDSRRGGRV